MRSASIICMAAILLSAPAAATPTVTTDYSMILGPPTKIVKMQGSYVEALSMVLSDWIGLKRRPSLLSQNVSISPKPGTHLIYLRFMPSHVPAGQLGGGDVLYVFDLQKRKILSRVFPM